MSILIIFSLLIFFSLSIYTEFLSMPVCSLQLQTRSYFCSLINMVSRFEFPIQWQIKSVIPCWCIVEIYKKTDTILSTVVQFDIIGTSLLLHLLIKFVGVFVNLIKLIEALISVGLRKLEAFFAVLITVMALTFGYEVRTCFLNDATRTVPVHHEVTLYPPQRSWL